MKVNSRTSYLRMILLWSCADVRSKYAVPCSST